MAAENIIAVMDIGTTKITVLVGEMDDSGCIYVIGHGLAPSDGLRRGVVVDMEKTVNSFRKAADDAQMVSGTEIDSLTVSIAGEHIRSINSHGVVAVNRSDNEITAADVKRAINAARTIAIPVDREIIHVIPQQFSVDDQDGIKDPVGMSGVRLEVEAHIVTASVTTARNIYRALERCHLGVNHIVLEALALSEVILTDEETEAGVIVVDIGGDLSNVAVFQQGAVIHTAVITLGGRNVTSDIAIGLRTPMSHAEELKLAYGAAMATAVNPEEIINVPNADGTSSREVSRNVLASIIEPRMEEILSLVLREVKRASIHDTLTGGVVLTGGGALLPVVRELAERLFDMPVRLGTINGIDHVPDDLNDNRYAAAHGLLIYGFGNDSIAITSGNRVKTALKRFEDWITKRF